MKIERVVKKDDENVIVYFDTQEKLFLSYEIFMQNRLKKDMEISEDGFALLIRENRKYFIKKKAFNFLGRRMHSYNELKLKLLRKKYEKVKRNLYRNKMFFNEFSVIYKRWYFFIQDGFSGLVIIHTSSVSKMYRKFFP